MKIQSWFRRVKTVSNHYGGQALFGHIYLLIAEVLLCMNLIIVITVPCEWLWEVQFLTICIFKILHFVESLHQ